MPIIEVKSLSKKYHITSNKGNYRTLRDSLADLVKHPVRKIKGKFSRGEEFWALKDISFSVEQGEVLGVIGPNGAGKSTLLKILSRITPPTSGEAILRGRVASLLEVGTGFHPELSGRENIFMNGALLGMARSEIVKKFDEIVDFSGIAKFIDTPVKHYSSGMYVRLAFSVAAHMEPDILLIDEVLAVGDAEFQKKCLGKMDEVTRKAGRTIIFISHNLHLLKIICNKCIFISEGRICMAGTTSSVSKHYLDKINYTASQPISRRIDRKGHGGIRMGDIAFENCNGDKTAIISPGDSFVFSVRYDLIDKEITKFDIAISILDFYDQSRISRIYTKDIGKTIETAGKVEGTVRIKINHAPLNMGKYLFNAWVDTGGIIQDWIINAGSFEVGYKEYLGKIKLPPESQGHLLLDYDLIA